MKNIIISILLTISLIFSLGTFFETCNPKGSLADQINWAGNKTCELP